MTELFRHLPPLGSLVAFEAAYRHQSFTRAADELALSQASISRRVRELEQFLGLKLFERKRYDVVPTSDGENFALTVRTSLSEIAKTTEQLRVRSDRTQRLTVFSDISLAQALIVPMIGEISISVFSTDGGAQINLQSARLVMKHCFQFALWISPLDYPN